MTIPRDWFGDLGLMEEWLASMCPGCVHEDAEEAEELGLRGIGCDLTADAYRAPGEPVVAWQPCSDAVGELMCERRREARPLEPEPECDGQMPMEASS